MATNLRRLRIERQISQEHLAVDAGVDRTYVSGIERGEFNPSVDLLARLTAAMNVDISELFLLPSNDEPPTPLKRGRRPTR